MICDQNHAGSKGTLQAAVWKPFDLILHALVAAYMDFRRGPPLRHGYDQERHALFREGHEAVIVVFVDQIERCSDVLRYPYARHVQR